MPRLLSRLVFTFSLIAHVFFLSSVEPSGADDSGDNGSGLDPNG